MSLTENASQNTQVACNELEAQASLMLEQEMLILQTISRALCHELNNTFSGILGYAELAMSSPEDKELATRAMGVASRGARRGSEFIRRLGFFAHYREENMWEVASLSCIIDDALEMFRPELENSSIRVDIRAEANQLVQHNPALLRLLFMEILQNAYEAIVACKREDGVISVTTAVEGENVVTCIADNGPGLPPDKKPLVFGPFYSTRSTLNGGDDPRTRGLGLLMARRIAAAHKGTITFDTVENQGSTVCISLPVAKRFESGRRRIMVVDDEKAMISIYTKFLSKGGYDVLPFSDGQEAVEVLRREKVDLVLLDQIMPDFSGLDMMARMKELGIDVPVIMVSAAKDPEVARRAFSLGAVTVAAKPVNRAKMLFLIANHFQRTNESLPEASRHDVMPSERILVVDRDALSGEVIELCLRRAGYATNRCRDFKGAEEATREEYYDLILLDPLLSDKTPGFIVRALRLNNPYTPIVILSGNTSLRILRDAREAGATHEIRKPVEVQRLLRDVQSILAIFRDGA